MTDKPQYYSTKKYIKITPVAFTIKINQTNSKINLKKALEMDCTDLKQENPITY